MDSKTLTFTISLDISAYRRALYWNFFCKSKRSTFLILFLFGCSFFTISYSFLLYKTGSAMFFVTILPALFCMLLPLYFVWQLERQIKNKASSMSMEDATKKEIRINSSSLSVVQISNRIASECTWHAAKGVYPTKDGLMIYLDNGQIIVMLESQTSREDIEHVKNLAIQNNCLKKGISSHTVCGAFLLLGIAGFYLIAKSIAG